MQSKISFFNTGIFKKNATRFLPLWIAYLALWMFLLPFLLLMENSNGLKFDDVYINCLETILHSATTAGYFIEFCSAAVIATAVWSYLYSQKSTGMMAALPVTRNSMFFTNYMTGILIPAACHVIIFLLSIAITASNGLQLAAPLLKWLLISTLSYIFFFSFATFAAMLTGHILVVPIIYTILNFVSYIVTIFLREGIFYVLIYGYIPPDPPEETSALYIILSPLVYMMRNMRASNIFNNISGQIEAVLFDAWLPLSGYFAAGLVLAFLALLLYRRRKMEAASDIVAVAPLRPVFKYCLCFGCALISGTILSQYNMSYSGRSDFYRYVLYALAVTGGAIGYYAAEMLNKKSFKVFKSGFKGFAASSACIIFLCAALQFDLFGYEKRTPELDEIKGISISEGFSDLYTPFDSRDDISHALDIHQMFIDNKADINRALETYGMDLSRFYSQRILLKYELSDDSTMSRQYFIPVLKDDDHTELNLVRDFLNTDEAIRRRYSSVPILDTDQLDIYVHTYDPEAGTNKSVHMSPIKAREFYDSCVSADIQNGNLGYVLLADGFTDYDNRHGNIYGVDINVSVNRKDSEGFFYQPVYWAFTLTSDSENVLDWLSENDIPAVLKKDIPIMDENTVFASPSDVYITDTYLD